MTTEVKADTKEVQKVSSNDRLDKLEKGLDTLVQTMSKTRDPRRMFANAPNVREGENVMGSRGFSFMRLIGCMKGEVLPSQAKHETDISTRLYNAYSHNNTGAPYESKGLGQPNVPGGRFLAPLATSFMQDSVVGSEFRREMREMVNTGVDSADIDEMKWIRRKMLGQYGQKTLSWLNELNGGALVAPQEQGELIELLRNKEALVNAGARTVPLPPQGRMKFPRQTAPSSTYWVGENAPITASDIGTGEVTLQAKKLAVRIIAPNELLRFASPAAEALMRDDMTKSLALGLDLAGLEGLGGDNQPLGLINQQGINTMFSSAPGPNGDSLVGGDIYRAIALIEENNAEMEGFVMRPKTLYKYYQLRSDAVAQGDQQGPFLFNLIREAGDGTPPLLGGYPVTKSTQISQVQTKGSATNLTYIAWGMWSDMLIGMFGAIEFAANTLGDSLFINDQTAVRGILSADVALRHAAAFGVMNQLQVNA